MVSKTEASSAAGRKTSATDLLLWITLFLALSPVLVDLGKHWHDDAWARYSLVFPPLLAWSVRHSPYARPKRTIGLALVAFALLLGIVAAKAATLKLGRPALPMAVIGLMLATGLAPLRSAVLALWIIPVPHLLADLLGGHIARVLFAGGAGLLSSSFGLDLQFAGLVLFSGGERLAIDGVYAGLPLFVLLAGLAWYRALRLALTPLSTLRCLLLHLLCGVPIQLAAIAIALLAFALGSGTASGFFLESAPWLLTAAVAIFLTERGAKDIAR